MSLHPEDQEIEHLQDKFNLWLCKFHRATDQLSLLDQRIKDMKIRHGRAIKNQKNAFRYTLRQRLTVLFCVKMMYFEYAGKMADEMDEMYQGMREIYCADADGNSGV